MPQPRFLIVCLLASLILSAPLTGAEEVDFLKQIRPIFKERCWECHGPDKQESGLRLDRRQDALAGGDSGKVILPGDAKESLLIKYVSGDDPDLIMPPDGDNLTRKQIDLLIRWIDSGADWPDEKSSVP